MTHRDEILAAHPDWFALYGDKRQNQPGQRLNQLCYSNDELLQETVRYVRAVFDIYKRAGRWRSSVVRPRKSVPHSGAFVKAMAWPEACCTAMKAPRR
jgi:hypothetical protein